MKLLPNVVVGFLVSASVVACSNDARLSGKTKLSNAEAAPILKDSGSTNNNNQVQPTEVKVETSGNLTPELEPEAIMPTPVGGAYLVCNSAPEGASCQAFDYQNQPYDMHPDRAYILTGNPVQWASVEFSSVGVGSWTAKLPAVTGSFGISFVDKNDQHLSDWLVKDDSTPGNLALDGGFEGLKIGSLDYAILKPAADYPWKLSRPSSPDNVNTCPVVWLEVQSVGTGMPSIDGNQWVEMNGDCDVEQNLQIYNVTLSQKIKVEAGHSYEIIFSYRSREPSDLEVVFGSSKFIMNSADGSAWKEARLLRKAESSEAELSFTGMTKTAAGGGTIIDKIRVYDLGAGPLK